MVRHLVEVFHWSYDYSTDVFPMAKSLDLAPHPAVYVFDETVIDFVVWILVVDPLLCFNGASPVVDLKCDVGGLP